MITGDYAVIRTAEPDDTVALQRFYDPARPRSSLLDARRELIVPTYEELREALNQKDLVRGVFHAVEDKEGRVRGFCSLRGVNPEVSFAQLVMLLLDDADFDAPLAREILDFLLQQAFERVKLNKVIAHGFEDESAFRAFLRRNGFQSDGIQREVVFTLGRWRHLESFSLFRSATPYGG